jgi:hypothetical protein
VNALLVAGAFLAQPSYQTPTYKLKAGEKLTYIVGAQIDGSDELVAGKYILETRAQNPSGSWDLHIDGELGVVKGDQLTNRTNYKVYYVVEKNLMIQKLGGGQLPLVEHLFYAISLPSGPGMPGSKVKQTTEYKKDGEMLNISSKLSGTDLSGTIEQVFDPAAGKLNSSEVYIKTSKGGIRFGMKLEK